jgi:hypothetical protein
VKLIDFAGSIGMTGGAGKHALVGLSPHVVVVDESDSRRGW